MLLEKSMCKFLFSGFELGTDSLNYNFPLKNISTVIFSIFILFSIYTQAQYYNGTSE